MTEARCPLVREIEEAAALDTGSESLTQEQFMRSEAAYMQDNEWWPRIRAALEAAEETSARIRNDYEPGHPAWQSMDRYREATSKP